MPAITDALDAIGITTPFPIQEQTIPIALTGTDVVGQARTGTGKTLAFGVPLLQRVVAPRDDDFPDLAEPGKPQALVIAPTRELAVQVTGDISLAGSRRDVRVLSVYGGRAYEPQVEALRKGIEVVVGTPGRLLDLANQGRLDLGHVKVLVLDEADEMLDLGFLPDVEKLIQLTPDNRQTMLFSATMPGAVLGLARQYLRQPTNIRAEASHEAHTVPETDQYVYRTHPLDKPELLARILQSDARGLTMVFCKTKRTASQLAETLADRGYAAAAVHGDLGQGAREQALRAFRKGKIDVLVATDVAARGIDVEGVTHVVNYQCPEDEKTYLHRIGRTGRAGASGVAITFVAWEELTRWKTINNALSLGIDEPAETYSTSEHVYSDLGIPSDATGVLPHARRTRAGLGAEEVEDLGETGKARSRPGGRSGGSRSDRGRSDGGQAERGERDGGERPPRPARKPRERTRTRSGQPLDAAGSKVTGSAADSGTAPAAEPPMSPAAAEGTATPRRRRRRRSSAG
jgi:superfamily II DNA/RNA helicase